ncbi:hypothetical protein NQ176_g10447 [Zarea fungicola]|uniref:Uncharacterized protein n=1 Tax=Zarea fungicola TaxID=93591 RepID=A0ACC1MGI8_9HYPO|nr:hypothetical protein NQ176_g10447 [Lecanicillium fungicola]
MTKSMVFSAEGQNATPDPAIKKLEDQVVMQQAQELDRRIKNSSKASARTAFGEYMPARPSFGSNGKPIVVWTNSFAIAVKPITLHKYPLKIQKVIPEEAKKDKDFKEPEIRGRKLQLVIDQLLQVIQALPDKALIASEDEVKLLSDVLRKAEETGNKEAVEEAKSKLAKAQEDVAATKKKLPALKQRNKLMVTEFKSQLVSLQPLFITTPVRVVLSEEAIEDGGKPREEHFDVELLSPTRIELSDMLNYLQSMKVAKDDDAFPRHPEVIDVVNMILSFRPRSNMNGISVVGGSKFYSLGPNAQIESLLVDGRPLIASRGFFQSARLGTGRLLLNTQVTHGVFKLSGQAVKIFRDLGFRPCMSSERKQIQLLKAFSKCICKMRASVTFTTPSGRKVTRVKAIEGLVLQSELTKRQKKRGPGDGPKDQFTPGWEVCGPEHVRFYNEELKGHVSVKEHFRSKYGLKLDDYPLFNFGRGDKNSFFPAEVVEIQAGQQAKLKLTGRETTSMINFACRSPYSNATSLVEESRQILGQNDKVLEQFQVAVGKNLLAVQARVLPPPQVLYSGKPAKVAFGSWNLNGMRVVKSGTPIERWSAINILSSDRDRPVSKETVAILANNWRVNMGMAISPDPVSFEIISKQDAMDNQLDRIFRLMKDLKGQLIIFILSQKDSGGLYNKIKTLGDCEYGIHTCCIVAKQLPSAPSPGTLANIGLKVNLKFGGINHKLSEELDILKEGRTMFVGYDVTHPTNMETPKSGKVPPSLVGLVGSVDKELGQWPSATWEQASKQEILGERFEAQFATRIGLWQQNNKSKRLDNIVVYRDGVSEGQFSQVLMDELPLMRSACAKKFPSGDVPKLTIIVSVKRHQTRFYPTSESNGQLSRSGNIANGTVVDRGVTQVRYWDFYLTAHDAIKGTARPAHYTVLLDEIFRPRYNQKAADQLEKVTHELCYLFGRASKAVSICPPAYYADLVCERARSHRPEYAPDDVSEVSDKKSEREIHPELRNTMFYI